MVVLSGQHGGLAHASVEAECRPQRWAGDGIEGAQVVARKDYDGGMDSETYSADALPLRNPSASVLVFDGQW